MASSQKICVMENCDVEKVSPEKAVKILAKHNHKVTVYQAKIILDFLYKLANIAVSQHLRS